MKKLSTNEIRSMWLKFFEEKDHLIIKPAPLIPINDDTLLWINSGVAAIKTYFDGTEKSPAPRLVNSQPSIRTNDIENVGKTARHHTLFEMLGNFSIGDYFKKEAIIFAWEFLTSKDWLGFDPELLYITVFKEDTVAFDTWTNVIGIPKEKIVLGDKKTNFWEIGQGPCGPNTEIFYDRGVEYDPEGKGIELLKADIENDRYLEVWNLVFSQYNNDGNGNYTDLPTQNIDTGMGLERVASILQNAPTNYETDQFQLIIKEIEKFTDIKFVSETNGGFDLTKEERYTNMAFKAISDHIKMNVFSIADGAIHSNEKRGYVIRRLLRRAVNMGRRLEIKKPFLFKLIDPIIKYHQEFFPQLKTNEEKIVKAIKIEEEKFFSTIETGHKKLMSIIKAKNAMSSEDAFLLFNSFGFPIELTKEICEEKNIKVDIKVFNKLFAEHKAKAKSSYKKSTQMAIQSEAISKLNVKSIFDYHAEDKNSKVVAIIKDDKIVDKATGEMWLAFDETIFYVNSGGQISDEGTISGLEVIETIKSPNKIHLHKIKTNKTITVGDEMQLSIWNQRPQLKAHHSGSHIVHQAVKQLFGDNANQAGKFVGNTRLRFDFTTTQKLTKRDADKIESLVNEIIAENNDCFIKEMPYQEAIDQGAIALFTEKYANDVRTVKMGGSFELCGGTHVNNSSEVERFIMTSFESKGSGVYRIEGICSKTLCDEYDNQRNKQLKEQAQKESSKYAKKAFFKEVSLISDSYKENLVTFNSWKELMIDEAKKEQKAFAKELFTQFSNMDKSVKEINGINTLIISGKAPIATGKELSDHYQNKLENLIFIWLGTFENKSSALVSVSKELQNKISAKEILNKISMKTSMKGGGSPALAQAGGDVIEDVKSLILEIEGFIND